MNKGKLIRVRHPDGHYFKMYEADAVEQGLLPGAKALPAGENKLAPAGENKAAGMHADIPPQVIGTGVKGGAPDPEQPPAPPAPDDFTSIAGVGPATARLLVAKGLTSFAQLREAKSLGFLGKQALAAIEAWRAA